MTEWITYFRFSMQIYPNDTSIDPFPLPFPHGFMEVWYLNVLSASLCGRALDNLRSNENLVDILMIGAGIFYSPIVKQTNSKTWFFKFEMNPTASCKNLLGLQNID